MPELDLDLVRHALQTAADHGFAEVEIGVDGASFKARLEAGRKPKHASPAGHTETKSNGEAEFKLIKSPLVGFYRTGSKPLEPGKPVKAGDVVAVVNALGIANDVESTVAGEVVEVLVKDGEPVEFGQVLAKVKA
jgi:biotin carboxyl carrier protein